MAAMTPEERLDRIESVLNNTERLYRDSILGCEKKLAGIVKGGYSRSLLVTDFSPAAWQGCCSAT